MLLQSYCSWQRSALRRLPISMALVPLQNPSLSVSTIRLSSVVSALVARRHSRRRERLVKVQL